MSSCPGPFQFRNLPIVEPSNCELRNLRITEPYIAEPPNSDTLPSRIVVPVQLRNLQIVQPSECGILQLRNLAQPIQADPEPFQFSVKHFSSGAGTGAARSRTPRISGRNSRLRWTRKTRFTPSWWFPRSTGTSPWRSTRTKRWRTRLHPASALRMGVEISVSWTGMKSRFLRRLSEAKGVSELSWLASSRRFEMGFKSRFERMATPTVRLRGLGAEAKSLDSAV